MTAMGMYSVDTMSRRASAGSMDASASHTHCACARAAFRAIANVLDQFPGTGRSGPAGGSAGFPPDDAQELGRVP